MKNKTLYICLIILFACILNITIAPVMAQIKTAKMEKLNISFNNVTFKKSFINNLNINASNVDFSEGKIGDLSAKSSGFINNKIILDNLEIAFKNVFFYTDSLFSGQKFILKKPVKTQAKARITQLSLNKTLNQPKLLNELSNLTRARINNLGIDLNIGLISFHNPKARILPNNTIQIEMMGSMSPLFSFPVKYITTLNISNSKLILTSPQLIASGIALPIEVTNLLNQKLSSIMDIDERLKEDAEVTITSINMIPDKEITITAEAIIKKLEFSKRENDIN